MCQGYSWAGGLPHKKRVPKLEGELPTGGHEGSAPHPSRPWHRMAQFEGGGRKGDTPPVTHQGSFTIYMPNFFQDKLFPPYFPPIWPMRPGVLSLHPPWYLGVSGPLSGQNESICFTTPQTPTPPTPPHNSQAIFLTMVIFRGSTSTA